jgi:hypothetical protein
MDRALIAPVVLCIEYGVIAVYVFSQIVVLFLQRHRPFHYKSIFNWFAITWMSLRCIFWGLQAGNVDYSSIIENFIFWLPSCILFLTFCTLALFLTKVVMSRTWQKTMRTRALVVFGIVAVFDVAGSAVLSVLISHYDPSSQEAQVLSNFEAACTALLFFFIAAVFA